MELVSAALTFAETAEKEIESATEVFSDMEGSMGVLEAEMTHNMGAESAENMGALETEAANNRGIETVGNMGAFELQNGNKPANQISFGSLAGKNLECDSRYTRWKDGVSYAEISKKWMDELANEISDIFGNDQIDVVRDLFYDNAAMYENGTLKYDPIFMKKVANECGQDSIISIFSHEVGHRLVNILGLEDTISCFSDVENEACADYIAGLVTRLSGLNPEHMVRFYGKYNNNFFSPTADYPSTITRINSFLRGYQRIENGAEAASLRTFKDFRCLYDQLKIYHDKELLKQILLEDVVEPIRAGTL